jgi:two-component system response regulator PilR (NtrC family)
MGHLLFVEDDPDTRPVFEHILRADGHTVDVARTVEEACALIERRTYDLVVTDGMLPDGTGIMVADCAAWRGFKTLVITAYGLRFSAAELQRHPYLLKPVRRDELLDVVRQRLGAQPA